MNFNHQIIQSILISRHVIGLAYLFYFLSKCTSLHANLLRTHSLRMHIEALPVHQKPVCLMIRIRVSIHGIIMLLKLRFNYCIRFVIERKQQTSNGKRSLRRDLEKREWILRINMCFIGLERWAIRASIKRYRHNPNYSNRINIKKCVEILRALINDIQRRRRDHRMTQVVMRNIEKINNTRYTQLLENVYLFKEKRKFGEKYECSAKVWNWIIISLNIWMNWMDQSELISTIYFCLENSNAWIIIYQLRCQHFLVKHNS